MPYLNVDIDFLEHRKTRRLVGLLGKGSEVLILRLWTYAARFHAEDGSFAGYTPEEIESIAGWTGDATAMLQAMLKVAYLDQTPEGVVLHGWKEHQGHIAEFRSRGKMMAEARWARARDAASNAARIAASNAETPAPAMLPQSLQSLTNKETHTRAREESQWPSLEEALKHADLRGIPRECAEKWWHEHDARGGCDRHGQPLTRWESALTAFATTWRAVEAQQKARASPNGRPNPVRTRIDHSKGF